MDDYCNSQKMKIKGDVKRMETKPGWVDKKTALVKMEKVLKQPIQVAA